jgi:[protein-PII] uridylyltransferase
MLYLLTYADISAVNPTAWTQWKAALLQDLYLRTLVHLDESAVTTEEEQVRISTASTKIKEAALPRFSPGEVDAFLADVPLSYLLHTPEEKAVHHLWMMKRLPKERLVIEHRHDREKGYTELTVCAYDAYGMLSRASGTLAAKNLNILRAQAYTTKSGVMIDTFQITDPDGNIYTYEDAWESVKSELRAALTSEYRPSEPGVYISEKTGPATQAPLVEFDIDVSARDKVGLLYRMTRTLFDLNLDIASAKIVTEGTRVMDSFYVTDLFKKKILDNTRTMRIREALLKVLE